jgi:hypothetical protein
LNSFIIYFYNAWWQGRLPVELIAATGELLLDDDRPGGRP